MWTDEGNLARSFAAPQGNTYCMIKQITMLFWKLFGAFSETWLPPTPRPSKLPGLGTVSSAFTNVSLLGHMNMLGQVLTYTAPPVPPPHTAPPAHWLVRQKQGPLEAPGSHLPP